MNPIPSHRPKGDLAEPDGFWTQELQFHAYDVDFRRRATVSSLCRYFLDAAWNHAEQLGVGYNQLAQQGRFWVLSRLWVQFGRFPEWGEPVRLTTWPREPKGVFALRDFEFSDRSGLICAAGVSAWLVLQASDRKLQRLDRLRWTLKEFPNRRAVDCEPQKLAKFAGGTERFTRAVRYSDLDVNDHVNSVSYIAWLLDCYSTEFHQQHRLKLLEINYVGETRAAESVSVHAACESTGTFLHSITKAGGEEVCRAQLHWESGA